MPNFLSRIFRPDDTARQIALSTVTQGRIEIENASHRLEAVIGKVVREQKRLRQGRSDEHEN